MLPDLRDLLDVRIGVELLGEDQMMASADIPHGEARERSMDIARADGSVRPGQKRSSVRTESFYNL
jgi:hypothetical protein